MKQKISCALTTLLLSISALLVSGEYNGHYCYDISIRFTDSYIAIGRGSVDEERQALLFALSVDPLFRKALRQADQRIRDLNVAVRQRAEEHQAAQKTLTRDIVRRAKRQRDLEEEACMVLTTLMNSKGTEA